MFILFSSSFLKVIHADTPEFRKAKSNHNETFITLFFAPWCGHCQQFKPDYHRAADKLDGIVDFYEVDCTNETNQQLCGEMGVKGYPTIKLFNGQSRKIDYEGARTVNDVIRFIMSSIKHPFRFYKHGDDISSQLVLDGVIVLTKSEKASSLLYKLAKKYSSLNFLVMTGFDPSDYSTLQQSISSQVDIAQPLNLLSVKNGEVNRFSGENNADAIDQWLKSLQ